MQDLRTASTRRHFLLGAGSVVTTALAGCIEGPGGTDLEEGIGYAAFFPLADWGNHVGGDHFTFENPVAVGELGHGWDPGFDVVAEAANKEMFLYLDSPEFAWAQQLADTLASDHEAVTRLDVLSAIPPEELRYQDGHDGRPEPDYDEEFDPETFTVGAFEVLDAHEDAPVLSWHAGHWDGGLPPIPLDGTVTLSIHVEDIDGRIPPLGEGHIFQVTVRQNGTPDEVLDITATGATVTFEGLDIGQTQVVFELWAGDELVFDTAGEAVPIEVVDSDDRAGDVFYDPHTWIDPVLAVMMIEAIADTLASVDPDHAADFESNAASYIASVEAVHTELETLVSEAALHDVVLAGHDSFGYIANRYGIDFHTPVGISPDAEVTLDDISTLAATVEEHGIDTVLYDPFEAPDPDAELPQAVEVLLENTSADNAAPLSTLEGTTPAWNEAGYGWVEQWTEINLPSLRQAMGVGGS